MIALCSVSRNNNEVLHPESKNTKYEKFRALHGNELERGKVICTLVLKPPRY